MIADWNVMIALGLIALGCRLSASLAERLGQPAVVGQMLMGIALGPTVLGLVAPHLMTTLLPTDLVAILSHLGQIGVALFALAIGAEIDTSAIRRSGRTVVAVATGAMTLPVIAGIAVALGIGTAAGVRGGAAGDVFAGVAVSVTAFPVLCKIVDRIGLTRDRVGQMAILTSSISDVAAWSLLAVVVALAHKAGPFGTTGAAGVLVTLATAAALGIVLLLPVRWFLTRWEPKDPAVAAGLVVVLALVAGSLTALVGLHAIFGGFLAGLALPRKPTPVMARGLTAAHTLNEVMLLPLFFVTAGLQVDLRPLAHNPAALFGGLALVAVAILGKPAGALPAARLAGLDWRTSGAMAALLSSRGLTELVVLQVGLTMGLLTSGTYGLLVVMALVTTLASGPLTTRILRTKTAEPAPAPLLPMASVSGAAS